MQQALAQIPLLVACCKNEMTQTPWETLWIQRMFDRFAQRHKLSGKMEADLRISQRMGLTEPSSPLKVRFWRTRRHLPQTREECIRLGQALDLSHEEMTILLQRYYDGSDCVFTTDAAQPGDPYHRHTTDPLYQVRLRFVNESLGQYLARFSAVQQAPLVKRTPIARYVRHQFCLDALRYIHCPDPARQDLWDKHLLSSGFSSEFSRTIALHGHIPRKTMLRCLFLFFGPEVSCQKLNDALVHLGYAPLSADHALPGGQRLDALVLGVLALYETCAETEPSRRLAWLQSLCRALDQQLQLEKEPALRFLHFKALQNFLQ